MATLTILREENGYFRYRVEYEDGREPDEKKASATVVRAGARRAHKSFQSVLEAMEGIVRQPPEVVMEDAATEEPAPVAEDLEAVQRHTHRELVHDHPHEHPLVPHDHQGVSPHDLAIKFAGLRTDVDNAKANLLAHGHDDFAPRIHTHQHLEDSLVHAQENTARLGIEVAKLAELLATHGPHLGPHEHKGVALEVHQHDELQEIKEALTAALARIAELEAEPLEDHGHDNYALHGHRHDTEAAIEERIRTAEPHEHEFNTKVAGDTRWRCGICLLPKPGS